MVLAVVVSLLAAVGLAVSGPATAANTAPASVVIDTVTSGTSAPEGTPGTAVPTVLAKIGDTVHVNVSFRDSTGAPASFAKDTAVVVTSDRGGLTQQTNTVPAGKTSWPLNVTFSQAANTIRLTVTVGKGGTSVTTTASDAQRFDVVKLLTTPGSTSGTPFQQGIGGDNTECANATPTEPVCGVVILPHGAQSSNVLLSVGACDGGVTCLNPKGSLVQTLANLSGLYSKTDPATLVMKCDKTLCGGGAIQSHTVSFSRLATGGLETAKPCPAKGTIGPDQVACVDYVQSTRDNSGDTLLFLLFDDDMRGSMG